jgi:hypothetical protein
MPKNDIIEVQHNTGWGSGSYSRWKGGDTLMVAIGDVLQIMIAFGTLVVAIIAVTEKKK